MVYGKLTLSHKDNIMNIWENLKIHNIQKLLKTFDIENTVHLRQKHTNNTDGSGSLWSAWLIRVMCLKKGRNRDTSDTQGKLVG